jgi:hypothetical protein
MAERQMGGVLVSRCKCTDAAVALEQGGFWPQACNITGQQQAPEKKVSETQRHPEDRTLKKEIVMKRTINAIALFVAAMFITAGVWAPSVKATIPFDFTVNNTTVPSGTYIISSASTDHDVLCISDQKHVHLLTSALPNPAHAGKANVMVFHKYGNQYFLSEIRSADSSSMNLRLPVWKAEKRARMQTQETAAAAGPFSSDVMVALY